MKRVVITGLGAISPLGLTAKDNWEAMKRGENGIDAIASFDAADTGVTLASEVKGFDPAVFMDGKAAKRMDRFSQFAIAAAQMAFEDAGLSSLSDSERENISTVIGSGIGGLQTIEDQILRMAKSGPSRISPFFIPASIANMAAAHVSMSLQLRGACYTPVTACASGTDAVGQAFLQIRSGQNKIALCGGTEATVTKAGIAGFANMTALCTATDKDRASIPFDKERSGFVMGEGAAVLVLEELESAHARGAHIYAEIIGYGQSADAYHITSPDPDALGAQLAMKRALDSAGIAPDMIDYINAHGTSTPFNDQGETLAIKGVFGAHAEKLLISSTKSMTGHMLGAAGAIEALATVKALEEGIAPPTINYRTPDPACDLNYVPNEAIASDLKYAMSNSLGFGGHNATIVFKRYEA